MKRHCWVDRASYKMYPNLYTILVGRPGIGKGAALNPALLIAKEAATLNVLSDRLTIEYILERLAKGFTAPSVTSTGGIAVGTDSSALIFSPELSILIRSSSDALGDLSDLWDSREHPFDYGTRSRGLYTITKPSISVLAGSAPEWLVKSIPSDAVGGGFTRRVNFIYAKDKAKSIPWPVNHQGFRDSLVDDLRHISSVLRGEFHFSSEAKVSFDKLYSDCTPDEFDDEATSAYKTSKWAHATKLAMVLSASRGDDLVIRKEDFDAATVQVEIVLKDLAMVFRAVGDSDLVNASDRILKFVEMKGYASKGDMLHANWRHITSEDLDRILMTFVQAGIIAEVSRGNKILYRIIQQQVKP